MYNTHLADIVQVHFILRDLVRKSVGETQVSIKNFIK